jgi:catechol 2,3-dioxygenase-like lactoylglutathione lyase family enzyme
MRIDHAYVETRSFDRALAFWKALGFEVAQSWGDAGHRAAIVARDGARVVLAEGPSGAAPQRATVHFGVSADELGTLSGAAAGTRDVEVETPSGPTHWGTRWMRVRDPDGNLWAFESA